MRVEHRPSSRPPLWLPTPGGTRDRRRVDPLGDDPHGPAGRAPRPRASDRRRRNRTVPAGHGRDAPYVRNPMVSGTLGDSRPATLEIHERAYTRRIAPMLGEARLEELTRERLEGWLGELVLRDPARRAVEQAIATIRAMLSTAVAWDRLPTNPALRLRMPKPTDTKAAAIERVLTPEEIAHMLSQSGQPARRDAPALRRRSRPPTRRDHRSALERRPLRRTKTPHTPERLARPARITDRPDPENRSGASRRDQPGVWLHSSERISASR